VIALKTLLALKPMVKFENGTFGNQCSPRPKCATGGTTICLFAYGWGGVNSQAAICGGKTNTGACDTMLRSTFLGALASANEKAAPNLAEAR